MLPVLAPFYLVGGTALALQFGHRKSIDLDFFCDEAHDQEEIIAALPEPKMEFGRGKVFLGLYVNEVKCDFVHFMFPRVKELIIEEGIRMASPLEIAAMKLWAITRRGAKKDFIDLYFLMEQFSLKEMLDFFARKFPTIEPFMVIRSLTYFEDADQESDPEMYINISWADIKEAVQNRVELLLRG
jgi:predicted nucleotidyltransferase component of viral defense system